MQKLYFQEIADIRHSHSKLKKMLAEANTELGHAVRRAEQYETEVILYNKFGLFRF